MSVIMSSLQGFQKNPDGSYSVTDRKVPYGKITGTQISGLLGMNPWQTPFSTAVRMMRLYNEDITDRPAIQAGVTIEPKILDYINATHGDDIFPKREGDHETWVSDFDDEIFGGHIDGLLPDGAVVEIKTSSRPQDWEKGIPVHYHMQASLYAHFLKTDRIVFGVGFTDRDTLANPDKWVPTKDNTAIIETTIMDGFDEMMAKAERIYRDTVLNNRTPVPDMNSEMDRDIASYLDAQLWSENEVDSQIMHINELNDRIAEYKMYETELETSKNRMALFMDYNDIGEVQYNGTTVTRGTVSRTSIDTNQLKKDGLYDLYAKKKEYKTLKISNKRR